MRGHCTAIVYRCALEDAAMGVLQDEIEGSTEVVAEDVADEVAQLTAGASGGRQDEDAQVDI